VRLVERAGHAIRLTDEGERFACRIRSALADLAAAVREGREHGNHRRLAVSVLPSFAAGWLLPRLPKFMHDHPEIDLEVRASMQLVDFRREDVDVAVRYGLGQWQGVAAEFLMGDEFFPVCSPRIASGVPRTPQDLAQYTLLRSEEEYWEPWFGAAGLNWPEPDRGPMFNDSAHLLQAAADGQGVALGRRSLAGMDLENGRLVQPFAITIPSTRKFYLVYPPTAGAAAKLAAFREWVKREILVTQASRRTENVPGAGPPCTS